MLWKWWRRQSPSRQDRYATLGPLAAVLLFLAAIVSAFWYLRNEEYERAQESVQRDAEAAQQQIRLHLIENQEQLARIAREVATRVISRDDFLEQAAAFVQERGEAIALQWVDADRQVRAAHLSPAVGYLPPQSANAPLAHLAPTDPDSEPQRTFRVAKAFRAPAYSSAFLNEFGVQVVQVHVPLLDRNEYAGALIAEYSLEGLLRHHVPLDVEKRHTISVLSGEGKVLASTGPLQTQTPRSPSQVVHTMQFAPLPSSLTLRGEGYRSAVNLVGNALFWMVLALSVLTVWMLLGTWRHMRRRLQVQTELIAETNFRRAMENSMLTGMRAMDMEGRISYVNPAFCAMTGFSEHELIGLLPPYPHWPPEYREESMRLLQQELQGRTPAGGIEVKVIRKDGTRFDSRMYVSPLIDAKGIQTGWMTSMTNITEAKRIRDQLSASHERFTTVLEGLEAAVSVVSADHGELLFANRSYRLWFGADAQGHRVLAGELGDTRDESERADAVDDYGGLPTQELTDAVGEMREVYVESLDKWFDVRSRYQQWTDGRLAQMAIATDVTARRKAEDQAALQAEKAQVTSRLMTMGEMASSVAHELNQPLTAITNYCNGMVSRVKSHAISEDDLVAALEKTSRQAQRAGQIIHRIRNFVKKSGLQRQASSAQQIVDDAIELANFELKRRGVRLKTQVSEQLPKLMVDPILIEQVIVNLLRNSAEAIDNAKMPVARRLIELRVVQRHREDEGEVVEFTVSDSGPGVPDEMIGRLYEAFFSTKADGMGIGLSLCRSIIESHQGRIRAENLYNGANVTGCRFTFTVPVNSTTQSVPPSAVSETENA